MKIEIELFLSLNTNLNGNELVELGMIVLNVELRQEIASLNFRNKIYLKGISRPKE